MNHADHLRDFRARNRAVWLGVYRMCPGSWEVGATVFANNFLGEWQALVIVNLVWWRVNIGRHFIGRNDSRWSVGYD